MASSCKPTSQPTHIDALRCRLEALYERFNDRKLIHPDPLEFIYRYRANRDREIVGLIAALLAYGRVNQILVSVEGVLSMLDRPTTYLNRSVGAIKKDCRSFRHRFTSGTDLSSLLIGIKHAIQRYGSIERCFRNSFSPNEQTVWPALEPFVKNMGGPIPHLFPSPAGKSACKRLNLFLKWMVRKDDVDPGCWKGIPPSKLIIPLDTHIHRIAHHLDWTRRKSNNIRTALEVTAALRRLNPEDPTRYDFALTRVAMRTPNFRQLLLSQKKGTLLSGTQNPFDRV